MPPPILIHSGTLHHILRHPHTLRILQRTPDTRRLAHVNPWPHFFLFVMTFSKIYIKYLRFILNQSGIAIEILSL